VGSPDNPELTAVLHSIDEHLRLLWLVMEELRVKLDEALKPGIPEGPDGSPEKTLFG
jgi:hypothetical protein